MSEKLPDVAVKALDVLANLVALAIVALIVGAMGTKTLTSFDRNILATSVTKAPLWIPQILVLWGFAQLWLDLFARIVRRITNQQFEWHGADAEVSDV